MNETPGSSGHRGGSSWVRPGPLPRRAVLALALAAGLFAWSLPAIVCASSSCVPFGLLSDSLSALHSEVIDGCHFGILAVSMDRGDTLLALNPDDRFIPASNMKLFVTGAFLKQFGPQARGALTSQLTMQKRFFVMRVTT